MMASDQIGEDTTTTTKLLDGMESTNDCMLGFRSIIKQVILKFVGTFSKIMPGSS